MKTQSAEPLSMMGSSFDNNNNNNVVGVEKKFLNPRPLALFYGKLAKEDIEQMLTRDGDFLLRNVEIRPEEFRTVLSVLWKGTVRNIAINQQGQFYSVTLSHKFKNLDDLLEGHYVQQLPLSDDGLRLLRPIYLPTWVIHHHDIIFGKKLGEGAFGEVFQCSYKLSNGRVVYMAAKTLHKTSARESFLEFIAEARLMRRLRHPNIVRVYGMAIGCTPLILTMEICPFGSLLNYLRNKRNQISMNTKNRFAYETACGMAYMETSGFMHRDIAARNCMLAKGPRVKVGDFGMAVNAHEMVVPELKKVPIKWLAIETMQKRIYSHKTDVWSYGVLLYELYSEGKQPYQGFTNMQVRLKLILQNYRMSPPEGMPPAVAVLMARCWSTEPQDRPSFTELQSELAKIVDGETASFRQAELFAKEDENMKTIVQGSTMGNSTMSNNKSAMSAHSNTSVLSNVSAVSKRDDQKWAPKKSSSGFKKAPGADGRKK